MHRSDKKLKLNVLESTECERDARFQKRLIFLQIFFLLSFSLSNQAKARQHSSSLGTRACVFLWTSPQGACHLSVYRSSDEYIMGSFV